MIHYSRKIGYTMIAFLLVLNFLSMLVIPVLLARFIQQKLKPGWDLFGIGAATFVLSQVGHIPFNGLMGRWGWLPDDLESLGNLVLTAVILGLSAAIFEEMGRYLAFRFWAKDARSWGKGLMMGAGHGGVEAILLGFIGLINVGVLYGMSKGSFLSLIPIEQMALVEQQIESLFTLPWYMTLLGAVERVFAICFHLSASLMVMQAVNYGKIRWLLAAIGWHALLDGVAVFTAVKYTPLIAEAAIGILALFSLLIIYKLRTADPIEPEPEPLPDIKSLSAIEALQLKKKTISAEHLEDSRYS